MSSLVLLQCGAYAVVCINNIKNTLTNNRQNSTISTPTQENNNRTFADNLSKRPKLSILYWGLGAISCSCSSINSIYLLSHKVNGDPIITQNNRTNQTSSFTHQRNTSIVNTNTPSDTDILTLNDFNRATVIGSVWAWNLCNVVEMSVFLLFRPTDDADNALMSTLFFYRISLEHW